MSRPLEGIRVIELTHVWSGPLCGQVLADLGAEVIRVENRQHLDIHRRGGPYPEGKPGINRSGTWNAQNRGKLGCTLDLKTPEAKDLLVALAGRSDAVIENFTPGTLARLGFGFDVLRAANPRIVLASLSGYGQTGPFRDSLAYGPMMDAATGLSAATTYADGIPRAVNGWAADVGGALYGCAAIVRALLEEPRTAVHLDISQYESGVMFCAESLMAALNPGTRRAEEPCVAATAATGDPERWIAVAARSLRDLEALGDLVGGRATTTAIVRHLHAEGPHAACSELERVLAPWAAQRSQAQALAELGHAGVPAVPVASVEDLLADTALREARAWVEVQHPEVGRILSYGPAIRLDDGAGAGRPAPLLGGDNAYVFGTILGLSAEQQQDLARRGIC